MSGLILKLRPNEKLLINGVVIQNSGSKARLHIQTADAKILRLRDAMHPDDARTPVKRAYYTAQLGLTGDIEEAQAVERLEKSIKELRFALETLPCENILDRAMEFLAEKNFYRVMRLLGELIPIEDTLINKKPVGNEPRSLTNTTGELMGAA